MRVTPGCLHDYRVAVLYPQTSLCNAGAEDNERDFLTGGGEDEPTRLPPKWRPSSRARRVHSRYHPQLLAVLTCLRPAPSVRSASAFCPRSTVPERWSYLARQP